MAMDKIANLNLETSANYQSLSDLNVKFWNQDKNTAVLQFQITRNNFPLSLSKENVEVFIKLESGANYIVDSTEVVDGGFVITDELNGIVSYTIPTEFMTVAKTVTGQVYVATKDQEEVVVQRKFSFEVAEDLLSTIPSSEKLKEIKLFAQLRDEVSDTMAKLNEDFANMQDYVTMVNQAATDGVNQLNTLSEDKLTDYNSNHTEKLNEITTTGDSYTGKLVEDKNYIDTKISEFEQKVIASDVIKKGDATNWQKYKITSDDGSRQYLKKGTITDITTLSPGSYETVSNDDPTTQNFPTAFNGASYAQIDVTIGGSNRKQIEVVHSYQGKVWRRYIHTDGTRDSGWLEIPMIDNANTLETKDGAQDKANTAESNANTFANEKVAKQHKVLFSGSVNGTGNKINLTDDLYNYNQIIISGEYTGGVFNEVILTNTINGDIVIQKVNLRDSDGMFFGVYEVKLTVTNGTTLTLSNDVSYDMTSDSPSGPNRNAFTVQRIEGYSLKGVDALTPVGDDKYATMTQLMSLTTEGTDWKIETNKVTNANTLVSAIHGGGIEPGSSELAKLTSEISGQNYYSFMGIRSSGNSDLHVTSTRFDEPKLLSMLNVPYTVAIHGASGSSKIIYLGGADTSNVNIMRDKLTQAGFNVQVAPSNIDGSSITNVVNKNTRKKGVQLELTTALRQSLFADNNYGRVNREDRSKWSEDMTKLATAISDAIKEFKN